MVGVAAAIAPGPVRPRLRPADLAAVVALFAAVFPARPAGVVGHRAGLLAPARQSRPRPAAHDRQAGRAAADGRHLPDAATRAAAGDPRATRRAGGPRFRPAGSRLVAAPPGETLAGGVLWPAGVGAVRRRLCPGDGRFGRAARAGVRDPQNLPRCCRSGGPYRPVGSRRIDPQRAPDGRQRHRRLPSCRRRWQPGRGAVFGGVRSDVVRAARQARADPRDPRPERSRSRHRAHRGAGGVARRRHSSSALPGRCSARERRSAS